MVGFLSELLSVFGKRKVEEHFKHSSKPESSPAKRQRQDQMPNDQPRIVTGNKEPTETPSQQQAPHQAMQQRQQLKPQQAQMQQDRSITQQPQQQLPSLQHPSRHQPGSSVRQRPVNNTFKQLQLDAQRASHSPAFAGGSQPRVSSRAFDCS
jgi:hypothetical protein